MKLLRLTPSSTGKPRADDPVQAGQQGQVVAPGVLPKPMPGSSQIRSRATPAAMAASARAGQEGRDLGHHVVVARLGLHGARLALHVHQHHLAAELGGDGQAVRRTAQRGDVVPDRRAGRDGGAGHGGLHGVDGDRDVALGADRRDQRDDAGDLLGLGDRRRRPAGWTRRRCRGCRRRRRSAAGAWASGRVGSRKRPPSEKLSGVTLTTPMTRTGARLGHRRSARQDRAGRPRRRGRPVSRRRSGASGRAGATAAPRRPGRSGAWRRRRRGPAAMPFSTLMISSPRQGLVLQQRLGQGVQVLELARSGCAWPRRSRPGPGA